MSLLDRIQRAAVIRAPRSRVWRALTDIRQFCAWFSAESPDPAFLPGAPVTLYSTYPGPHYRMKFSLEVVDLIPETTFSWHWHPGVKLPDEDVSREAPTLVTFHLEEIAEGTRVTVTETGFQQLLGARRERVYRENEGGWKIQIAALERYCGETL